MVSVIEELKQLPVVERIQLVEDLWDTIALENVDIPLTDDHVKELNQSRAEMIANPEKGLPWATVKAQL